MSSLPDYYAKLLILQYLGKPKAYATIKALVTPVVMDELPTAVQNAYNLIGDNIAQGVQLDVIGKYVGITRNGFTFSGPVTLDDADYLVLIQLKIIQNSSGSSLAQIQSLLHQYFAGVIQVFDYQDMTLDYFFETSIGSNDLAEVFVKDGLLPRPMGVGLRALIYAPSINEFFGMRTYYGIAVNVNPFNSYTSYITTWPWLSYTNAISE